MFRNCVLEGECHIWQGAKTKGYAYARVESKGKPRSVHTYLCEKKHGPRPSSRHEASHICQRSDCLNEDHLVWETYEENMARIPQEVRKRAGAAGNEARVALERGTGKGWSYRPDLNRKNPYLARYRNKSVGYHPTAEKAREAYLKAHSEFIGG